MCSLNLPIAKPVAYPGTALDDRTIGASMFCIVSGLIVNLAAYVGVILVGGRNGVRVRETLPIL